MEFTDQRISRMIIGFLVTKVQTVLYFEIDFFCNAPPSVMSTIQKSFSLIAPCTSA